MCPADRPEQEILEETWNAWSQLLSAAEPAVDEGAVLAGIERRLSCRAARRRWPVAAALLAASVLLAVCWSALRPAASDLSGDQELAVQDLAGSETTDRPLPQTTAVDGRAGDLADAALIETPASVGSANDGQLFWDDEIGRDLAVVRSEAWHVEREWGAGLDVAASISWRMDDLEREFAESSL